MLQFRASKGFKNEYDKSASVIERKAHDGIPNTPSICVGKGISDEARGRPEPRQR
jgi:hypothetical protein